MFSFTMSDQRFDFDDTVDFTADELFAVAEILAVGDDDDVQSVIATLAAQLEAGQMTMRGARALICMAWIAHRRGGGKLDWKPFCRTVVPATLQIVNDAPAVTDGGPQRPSATRQRPKGRKP